MGFYNFYNKRPIHSFRNPPIYLLVLLTVLSVNSQTYRDVVDVANLDQITPDQLTQAQRDSGWRELFPNDTGFINHNNRFTVSSPGEFATGGAGGYLGTKKSYSHYELRAQIRHNSNNTGNNGGILYHADPSVQAAWSTTNLVLSIEYQGRIGDLAQLFFVPGDFQIPNAGIYAKSYAQSGDLYDLDFIWNPSNSNYQPDYGVSPHYDSAANSVEGWVGGPQGDRGPGKSMGTLHGGRGLTQMYYVPDRWNLMTLKVYGSDSAIHLANNVLALKLYDMRLADVDPNANSATALGSGQILFQSEGSALSMRSLWIKELDSTLCPINQVEPCCIDMGMGLCCKPNEVVYLDQCIDSTLIDVHEKIRIPTIEISQKLNYLIIKGGAGEAFQAEVYNAQGVKISTFENKKEKVIEVKEEGLVLVKIKTASSVFVQKFLFIK